MAMKFNRVKPGELIRAEVINSIFDALEQLDARSTPLPGDAVSILSLVPPPPWQANQSVQIQGINFGFSTGSTVLKFDDSQVNSFALGSGDSTLNIKVPTNIPGLGTGKEVVLSISNGHSIASRIVRVNPMQQPQQGNVDILWNDAINPNPNPNPITSGQQATLAYIVKSRALLPATFAINAQCSNTAMQSAIQVLDETQTLLPSRQIDVAPNQQKGFFIRIPSVTVNNGAGFSLTISGSSAGIMGADTRSFTVGSQVEAPDPAISLLAFNAFSAVDSFGTPDATASYSARDDTVHIKASNIGRLSLAAHFNQIGTYNLSVTTVGATAGWAAVLAGTPSQYVIEASDFTAGDGVASRNPEIGIQAQPGASATGQLKFTIQRIGTTQKKEKIFNLALLP
jgi:hypothetical protein